MSDIQKKKQAEITLEELNDLISGLEYKKESLVTSSLQKEEELKSRILSLSVEVENKTLAINKLDSEIEDKTQKVEDLYITYKSLVDENNVEKTDLKERESKIAIKEEELQNKELDIQTTAKTYFESTQKLIDREKEIILKEKDLQEKESKLKLKEDNLFVRENNLIVNQGLLDDKEKMYYKTIESLDKREVLIKTGETNLKNAEEAFRVSKLQSINLADQNKQDIATQKEVRLDIETRERKVKLEEENIDRIKTDWAKKEANLILREEEVRYREKQVAIKEKTLA